MGRSRSLIRRSRMAGQLGPPVRLLLVVIGLMWTVEIVDWFIGYDLDNWGIHPRRLRGLAGIVSATFLHGGFAHLSANTVPLFFLGLLISLGGMRHLVQVSSWIVLLGGAGVWMIGKQNSVHLGASGLVFGYFGYLLLRGVFDRSVRSLLVGLVVLLLYGGLIWGVLPTDPHVSWEGHLCGLIAGALASWGLTPRRRPVGIG